MGNSLSEFRVYFGNPQIMKRFMKGVFSLRPTRSHYNFIWLKVLYEVGIDTDLFTNHGTRAASCSAAKAGAGLEDILNTAGWSNFATFAKF